MHQTVRFHLRTPPSKHKLPNMDNPPPTETPPPSSKPMSTPPGLILCWTMFLRELQDQEDRKPQNSSSESSDAE